MKIVLAGSPSIAVPAFEEIIKNFDVIGIITQPDKKKGRGMNLTETPVSTLAKKYNIKLFKPNKIIEIKDELEKLNYDLFLTFAFGQWIPESILLLGKYKPLNIHGSLLPKYRGAAPIHHAILNGEKEIGITLMEMIKEMDAGNMYFKASKVIDEKTTTGEGFKIVEELAKTNITKWLKLVEENKVNPKQQSSDFTLAPKIKKEMGDLIKYSPKEAIKVIRALNPFPGAYIFINKKRLKVFDASIEKINNAIEVEVKNGKIFVTDFQWESKKRKNIW